MAEQLYRSRDDRMLAGVAAGVAETLDADPSLIRIAWALLAIFTGGIAFVVYIVMAIVVPEAPAGWEPTRPGLPPPWSPPGSASVAPPASPADPGGMVPGQPDPGLGPPAGPGSPGVPGFDGAPPRYPETPPIAPTGPAPGASWSGAMPAGAQQPSYWTSERDARRAVHRARREGRDPGRGGLIIGVILIVLGGAFLIREFVPWFDWHVWWPIGLIALGGVFLLLALRAGRSD